MRRTLLAFGFFALATAGITGWQTAETSGRTPASERESSSGYTCRIVTGYGTAIGRGSSKLKATENAREICGSKLIDDYFARRGQIDPSVEDDLALACVNLDCI